MELSVSNDPNGGAGIFGRLEHPPIELFFTAVGVAG